MAIVSSVPRSDEQAQDEQAHDVLAADQFAVPAPDSLRHTGPVVLPDDPTGDAEPHDILAAEGFAIPAANHTWGDRISARPGGNARLVVELLIGLAVVMSIRRRGRRR
jgi:hypothetical protein